MAKPPYIVGRRECCSISTDIKDSHFSYGSAHNSLNFIALQRDDDDDDDSGSDSECAATSEPQMCQ